MYHNGIQSYRRTNVITADSGKLVLMCYEGAIDNLIIAKKKYDEKDHEGKYKAITKAQNIIDELMCSLDFEKGGSIARNLESLYNYITRRIIHADVNRDLSAFEEVIGMLRELLSAWEEVYPKQGSEVQLNFDENKIPQVSGYISE